MSSEQATNPKLLTVKEFAAKLGVSTAWVYRHVGELPHLRVGNIIRFYDSQKLGLQSGAVRAESCAPTEESRMEPERIRMGYRRYQRGSVYRTPSGWRGFWREDVITADGKVKRKKIHRSIGTLRELPTMAAARKKLDEIISGSVMKTDLTFRELHDRWLKAIGPTLKHPTLRYYSHNLEKHLLSVFGPMQITEITRYQVQLFLAGKAPKYSRPSLRGMRTTLQKVLTWAVECDWLKSNPCSGIKVPRSEKKPRIRHVLTPQQVLLLAGRLDKREAVLVIFLAATGLRISEAVALKWGDLQLDGIHISRRLYDGRLDDVKSEKSERVVFVSESVRGILRTLSHFDSEWIFCGNTKNPLNAGNAMRRKIKEAIRELGLPNIGYHDFRHTLVSWLGAAKNSPKMIAEIVGHSDITTTLRIYTHTSDVEKSDALTVVARQLEQSGTSQDMVNLVSIEK